MRNNPYKKVSVFDPDESDNESNLGSDESEEKIYSRLALWRHVFCTDYLYESTYGLFNEIIDPNFDCYTVQKSQHELWMQLFKWSVIAGLAVTAAVLSFGAGAAVIGLVMLAMKAPLIAQILCTTAAGIALAARAWCEWNKKSGGLFYSALIVGALALGSALTFGALPGVAASLAGIALIVIKIPALVAALAIALSIISSLFFSKAAAGLVTLKKIEPESGGLLYRDFSERRSDESSSSNSSTEDGDQVIVWQKNPPNCSANAKRQNDDFTPTNTWARTASDSSDSRTTGCWPCHFLKQGVGHSNKPAPPTLIF